MRKLIYFTVIIALILAGCGSKAENIQEEKKENGAVMNISPKEAKTRLEKDKSIILLDVRTKEEYAEKHISGSMLIPYEEIENIASEKLPDKNAVIFAYCRTGRRSGIASETLVKLGYKNVYNLGGIGDWPYETKSGID